MYNLSALMNILYFTHALNGLLMIGIPTVLSTYLTRRFNAGWRLIWIGAATYVLSQFGHIPFNSLLKSLLERGILPDLPGQYILLFQAVLFGLSAGLWEEVARYASYRWWAKDARTWGKALVFGSGHGGIEAIILGFFVLFTFVQMVSIRNTDLATLVPADQLVTAQLQVEAYWGAQWYDTLLGAVERVSSIAFHLSASVLVLQCFVRKQMRWLVLAILWHTLLNAMAVYSASVWGIYIAEALIGIFALISIGLIFALRTAEPEPQEKDELPPVLDASSIKLTSDNDEDAELLKKTRYN